MFHWQNLNDGKRPKRGGGIRHGRAWFGEWSTEWAVLFGWPMHFSFTRTSVSIAIGIASFHLSRGGRSAKEFRLAIHDGTIWLNFWHDPMGGYCRSDPFVQRTHSFNPADFLFGRRQCTTVKGDTVDAIVPMPEGVYAAKCTFETRTWKRPRSPFTLRRDSTDIEIPGGIPFQGKGENSWDCGDDGLWRTGCNGHDANKAVATVVESVLNSRKRYGRTSRIREVAA